MLPRVAASESPAAWFIRATRSASVALVDDAVAQGARARQRRRTMRQRRYVAPTLLAEVPDAARIAQEEIFGPVPPIAPFDSLDEVIARINAAPKPLALYLWSRDAGAVEQLRKTSSGSFCVNLCLQQYAHQNLPFGGVNNSGIGNAHGFFGFKAFSHERAVLAGGPFSALKLLFPPCSGQVKAQATEGRGGAPSPTQAEGPAKLA